MESFVQVHIFRDLFFVLTITFLKRKKKIVNLTVKFQGIFAPQCISVQQPFEGGNKKCLQC